MAKQTINIGASPNDGTGTPLRTAFDYTNQNFTELYTATGPSGNNIVVPGSATITGDLTVDTNVLKVDTTNDRVGINISPTAKLDVMSGGTSEGVYFRNSDKDRIQFVTPSRGTSYSIFGMATGQPSIVTIGEGVPLDLGIGTYGVANLILGTYNTERMRIDTSGNVGIGVTPSAWLSGYKALQINATTNMFGTGTASWVTNNWTVNAAGTNTYQLGSATAATAYFQGSGAHYWFNAVAGTGTISAPVQAMTLDASGKLNLGVTSPYNAARLTVQSAGGAGGISVAIQNDDDSYYAINFRNSSGTSCGSISCTTSSTAFNVSSDYRLKEAVQPLTGGLTRINALKPSVYKWKVNGSTGEGFIAHELADVVPFAVTGDKDAVDADGKPAYQGVDLSKLVPILVAAIQELTARVQTLEAK